MLITLPNGRERACRDSSEFSRVPGKRGFVPANPVITGVDPFTGEANCEVATAEFLISLVKCMLERTSSRTIYVVFSVIGLMADTACCGCGLF